MTDREKEIFDLGVKLGKKKGREEGKALSRFDLLLEIVSFIENTRWFDLNDDKKSQKYIQYSAGYSKAIEVMTEKIRSLLHF